MTRDELIARTQQLIDEGDRLVAQPSLGAMQLWLQLSDDLLSTAWGSMDRYHLAWLMVGKPKAIVRGRPMTADEESAYVREVATQKTAALRMSLDAVDRQHMPFVGESGGVGLGAADPDRPASAGAEPRRPPGRPRTGSGRPATRPDPRRTSRRGPAAGRRPPRPWGAPRPTARSDAAMTPAPQRVSAVGGTRTVPAPDPIATDYLLLGLRLDQHMPGLVDAYYGPADTKARVDMEQLRAPSRLRSRTSRRLPIASPARSTNRTAKEWLTAQLHALDAHALALAGEPLPYAEYVERCMGFAPRRHDAAVFDAAASAIDALLAGHGSGRGTTGGLGPAARDAGRSDRVRWPDGSSSGSAIALPARFRAAGGRGPARVDRPRPAVDRATTGTRAVGARGSTSTSTYRSRPPISSSRSPMRRTRATISSSPGRRRTWSTDSRRLESSMLLTNTPEGPVSEGLARYGTRLASPLDERADLLVELFERRGSGRRRGPARRARDGGAGCRAGAAARRS